MQCGVIAQSGERLNGIQEVGGSIPPGSTSSHSLQSYAFRLLGVPAPLGTTVLRETGHLCRRDRGQEGPGPPPTEGEYDLNEIVVMR